METLLYNTHHKSKSPRSTPMRVLCLGLSRSGTDSLRKALITLGIENPAHGYTIAAHPGAIQQWTLLGLKKFHSKTPQEARVTREEFDAVLGDCGAVTDFTAALFARDLVAAYPEAKVILNVRRDVEKWYKSVVATFGVARKGMAFGVLAFFSAELYWRRKFFATSWDGFFLHDFNSTAIWRYEEHSDMVRGLVPKERFLEWSVEDGWAPLCEFLEIEKVPQEPFPDGNLPKDYFEKLAAFRTVQVRAAMRNMVICLAVVGGIGAQAFRYWKSR